MTALEAFLRWYLRRCEIHGRLDPTKVRELERELGIDPVPLAADLPDLDASLIQCGHVWCAQGPPARRPKRRPETRAEQNARVSGAYTGGMPASEMGPPSVNIPSIALLSQVDPKMIEAIQNRVREQAKRPGGMILPSKGIEIIPLRPKVPRPSDAFEAVKEEIGVLDRQLRLALKHDRDDKWITELRGRRQALLDHARQILDADDEHLITPIYVPELSQPVAWFDPVNHTVSSPPAISPITLVPGHSYRVFGDGETYIKVTNGDGDPAAQLHLPSGPTSLDLMHAAMGAEIADRRERREAQRRSMRRVVRATFPATLIGCIVMVIAVTTGHLEPLLGALYEQWKHL